MGFGLLSRGVRRLRAPDSIAPGHDFVSGGHSVSEGWETAFQATSPPGAAFVTM